jgi:preprotein translocase subunit SecD
MGGSWWFRFWLIVALTLGSVWMLLPSFVGDSAHERNKAAAAQASGEEAPAAEEEEPVTGWRSYLPDTPLTLGLDLQGGIDLTLEIEVDEAVLSTVARDVDPIKDYAEGEGIDLADVIRVRGEPAVEIRGAEGTDLDAVRGMMSKRDADYQYISTREDDEGQWHRFELTESRREEISEQAVEQALETLRNRVNETGVKEPSIVRKGGARINVQLPGIDNIKQAMAVVGKAAVLEFFMVDEDFGDQKLLQVIQAAEDKLPAAKFNDDEELTYWLQETGRIGKKNRVLWEYTQAPDGTAVRAQPYILHDKVILTGDDVNDAAVGMDQFNEPGVSLEFKPAGGLIFADVTGANVNKRFAIVLDSRVQSAPNISEKIGGGRARITMGAGDYNTQLHEATVLSLVLRTGALPAPVTVGEVRTVGAQLGEDSIRDGIEATVAGGALVIVFMVGLYRNRTGPVGLIASPGAIAVVGLGLNIVYIMALLAGFGATLTLPGIAGIALTVGMAVDANIIIFERIAEELRLGKTARSAVDAGFEHALSAVVDANVTTAIAGVVLYSYGSGPIKGFAVTLLIGIATTLFTAIFVSRTFMDLLVRRSSTRLVL